MLAKFYQEFENLSNDFRMHADNEKLFLAQLVATQRENTEAITTLAENTSLSVSWTVKLSEDAETIARFSRGLRNIAGVLVSIAVIGGAIGWVFHHIGRP